MSEWPELITECVGAHDRCYDGSGAPCPYCEPVEPFRTTDGRFWAPPASTSEDTQGPPTGEAK